MRTLKQLDKKKLIITLKIILFPAPTAGILIGLEFDLVPGDFEKHCYPHSLMVNF
jgi:hypothetical protein